FRSWHPRRSRRWPCLWLGPIACCPSSMQMSHARCEVSSPDSSESRFEKDQRSRRVGCLWSVVQHAAVERSSPEAPQARQRTDREPISAAFGTASQFTFPFQILYAVIRLKPNRPFGYARHAEEFSYVLNARS